MNLRLALKIVLALARKNATELRDIRACDILESSEQNITCLPGLIKTTRIMVDATDADIENAELVLDTLKARKILLETGETFLKKIDDNFEKTRDDA